jgi:hypothetical protein
MRMRQRRRCARCARTATRLFPTSFSIPRPKRTKWCGAWMASTGNNPNLCCVLWRTNFRGDIAATDISRVLRMPGFANRKYNEAFLVRAVQETDVIYRLRDFALYEDSPEAPRRLSEGQRPPRRTPSGHRSQSEADWAHAKRALARGDNAGEIIRRIADYRSVDKADPDYYARHTARRFSTGRRVAPVRVLG